MLDSRVNWLIKPIILLGFSVLTGCASIHGSITEPIQHRKVQYVFVKNKNPTVIFENGLGATLDSWGKVYPSIAESNSAFAYNRAGYGKSEAVESPRDGEHIVDELRAILKEKQISPPYILVGHSLGGLYMQLFARKFPDEVGALVLVDSTHPKQLEGVGNPANWPTSISLLFKLLTNDHEKKEFNGIEATGQSIMLLPTFTQHPAFILNALNPSADSSDLAEDAHKKRSDLVTLYPDATVTWLDSGHHIPLEKPDAIINAIRQAITASESTIKK